MSTPTTSAAPPPVPITPEIQAEMNSFEFKSLDFVHIAPVPPSTDVRRGVCRYVGPTAFSDGVWVGVELVGTPGKNSGKVQDVKYFACMEGQGVFVRPELVTPFGGNVESVAAAIATVVQQPLPPPAPVASTVVEETAKPAPTTTPTSAPTGMSTDPKKNLSGHTELDLLGQIEELKEAVADGVRELKALQDRFEEVEVDLMLATEEKLSYEEQVADLQLQLELGGGGNGGDESDTAALVLGLRQKVEALTAEKSKLQGQVSALKDDLSAATENNQDDVVEQLTEKNLELEEQLEDIKKRSDQQKADINGLNEINLMLEEEIAEGRKESESLEAKLAELQERCDDVAGDTAQAKLQEKLRKVSEELRQMRIQLSSKKISDVAATARAARDAHTASVALQYVSTAMSGKRALSKGTPGSKYNNSHRVLGSVAASDVTKIVEEAGHEDDERNTLLTTHAAQVSDAASTLLSHVHAEMGVLDVCSAADTFVEACGEALQGLAVAIDTLVSARKLQASKLFDSHTSSPNSPRTATTTDDDDVGESLPASTKEDTSALHSCLYSNDDLFIIDTTVTLMMVLRQAEQLRAVLTAPIHHDRVAQVCTSHFSDSNQNSSIVSLFGKCSNLVPSLSAAASLHSQPGAASQGLSAADAALITQQLQRLLSQIIKTLRPAFASYTSPTSNVKGIWAAISATSSTSTILPSLMTTLLHCTSEGLDLASQVCGHPYMDNLGILAPLPSSSSDGDKSTTTTLMEYFTDSKALLDKASATLSESGPDLILRSSAVVGAASLFLLCASVTSFGGSLEQSDFDFRTGLFPTITASIESRFKANRSSSSAKQALLPFIDSGSAFAIRVLQHGGGGESGGWDATKSPLMELLMRGVVEAASSCSSHGYLSPSTTHSTAQAAMLLATDGVDSAKPAAEDRASLPDGADTTLNTFSPLLVWMGKLHPTHHQHDTRGVGGGGDSGDDMTHASIATVANLFTFGSARKDVNIAMSAPATGTTITSPTSENGGGADAVPLLAKVGDQCRERLLRALFLTSTPEDPSRTFLFGALAGVVSSGGDGNAASPSAGSGGGAAAGVSAAALIALEDERSALEDQVKKLELQLWEGQSEQGVFKQVQKELEITKKILETTEEKHRREKAKLEDFMEVEMTKLSTSKASLQTELRMLRTEAKLSPLSAAERRAQKLTLNYYSELLAGALLGGECGLGGVMPAVASTSHQYNAGEGIKTVVASSATEDDSPSTTTTPTAIGGGGYSVIQEVKRRTTIRNQRLLDAGVRAIRRYCVPFRTESSTRGAGGDVEVVGSAAPLSTFSITTSPSISSADVENVLLALHRSTIANSSKPASEDSNTAAPAPRTTVGLSSTLPKVYRFTTRAKCEEARLAILTKQ